MINELNAYQIFFYVSGIFENWYHVSQRDLLFYLVCIFNVIKNCILFKLQPLKYKIKKIPTHPIRFVVNFNNTFLKDFEQHIGENVIQLFGNTIFGSFLDITKCNF